MIHASPLRYTRGMIQSLRATITRGNPYCHQLKYLQTVDPDSGFQGPWTYSSPTRYTLSDFEERDFCYWEVSFPQPFTPYNKSCFSHPEAVNYAQRTVRNLREAAA